MADVIRTSRREMTSREVLEALHEGKRVIIEVTVLGKTIEMAIRETGGTYYCDTPMTLLTYETEEEMRTCLERYRLAEPSEGSETGERVRE